MSRLVLGPFNRVEGDLEVTLDIDDGRVRAARVSAPLYRGFETMLCGRPALDALVVAPRVCGICSLAQSRAAAGALAAALGVDAPPNGRAAADLLLAAENAADHLTHFALFFMPDFARQGYAGRPWHEAARQRFAAGQGQSLRAASEARLRLLRVVGLLAGKWPHSLAIQPGGLSKGVDLGERMRLGSFLGEFRAFLEQRLFADRLESIAGLESAAALEAWTERSGEGDFRLFLRISADLELERWGIGPDRFLSGGGMLAPAGLRRGGRTAPLVLAGLREDLSHAWMAGASRHPAEGVTLPDLDQAEAYSWCKAPRLDGASMEVGALARQVVAGHPLLVDLLASSGGGGNVRARVVARLVELALLVPAMEALLRSLDGRGAWCLPAPAGGEGRGCALVEAARGTLGHWLRLEGGRIAHYQIIAPTTWNFSPRDGRGQPGPLEQALEGLPVAGEGEGQGIPLLVQHVVRSFDPCMSCTVH